MYQYIILFIIIVWCIKNNTENYIENYTENNIKILNKTELTKIIINDNDNYYNTFNKIDLQVRKVSSIKEYKQKIYDSPVTISNTEKDIIINTINKIDTLFKKYKIIGFDGEKATSIKWNIGIIDGTNYENGYPHTRSNIIIIPKQIIFNNDLLKTLIHEKVHIYQKTFPPDIEQYLSNNKFKKVIIPSNNILRANKIRANPDINNNVYIDSNNNILSCKYNQNAKSIMDVTYYPINKTEYEHPYEFMAYSIEKDIMKRYNEKI